ncbi:MAG TPA: DNA polymerase Y family protein [Candidatus Binatia bacterium]|nr:DNA polymerase Y family protein [Candidatus Binatia bacterium]
MKSATSGRLACVDLPAFPLQLLLRRHPQWRGYPAAVIAEDKPQGLILWVNEKARQQGVLPGLRYAAAFSLAAELRAGEVSAAETNKAVADLARDLMRFTPEVEPSKEEPGVFWLDGAGLERLYPSAEKWACAVCKALRAQGFTVRLAAGFSRFGVYAAAKSKPGITVFRNLEEERRAARQVPLSRLNVEPEFRDALYQLGVKTVGGLLSLPPGGLRERFGKGAHRLYRMAAGDLWAPLEPQAPEEPVVQKCILDDPEEDSTRLLFQIKQLLQPLLSALARRHQALTALRLSLRIDHGGRLKETLRPAAPTLDAAQILDLVRLRLESLELSAGAIEIELYAESCAATPEQLRLFTEASSRDLNAANRALARLRAEFGDDAVVCARLADGHLPEAKFTWEPLAQVKPPQNVWNGLNDLNSPKVLVRRIIAKPRRLPGGPYRSHEDGWLFLGPKYGAIDKLIGPYVFSGGWWNKEIQREYYYAETRRGDFLWLYYDRVRRRWFLQGAIE